MAWIKIRSELPQDPAIIAIARELNMDEYAVVGRLVKFWAWADGHTYDGDAHGVTEAWLDRMLESVGFARAMVKVTWLNITESGISIPNFDHHNGQTAKSRALTAKRMVKYRDAPSVTSSVTSASPEKRREEYINARAPQGVQGDGNASSVTEASLGRNGLEKTVVALWPGELHSGGIPRVEALARSFAELGATPETLRAAKAKADKTWTSPGGPEAILKHFGNLVPKASTAPPVEHYHPPTEAEEERNRRLVEAHRKTQAEFAARNGIALAPAGSVKYEPAAAKKGKAKK